jgi:phosphoglycerol transferase MdoB-like AlkP superfamily enzyme
MVNIGKISYPLYLWHWPLLSFAAITYGGPAPILIRIILVIISFVLAYLSYRYVELLFKGPKHRRLKVFSLITLLVLIATISIYVEQNNGFENRTAETAVYKSIVKDGAFEKSRRGNNPSCIKKLNLKRLKDEVCFTNSDQP